MSEHWMRTKSGIKLDLGDLHPDMVVPEDILAGLSREGRYGNQNGFFISVAEHSMGVSKLVPPYLALPALFHDGSEAYIKDLPTPLKSMLPNYMELEAKLQDMIYEKFAFIPGTQEREMIKKADLQMLKLEAEASVAPHCEDWPCLAGIEAPENVFVVGYLPDTAKKRFYARYLEILNNEGRI